MPLDSLQEKLDTYTDSAEYSTKRLGKMTEDEFSEYVEDLDDLSGSLQQHDKRHPEDHKKVQQMQNELKEWHEAVGKMRLQGRWHILNGEHYSDQKVHDMKPLAFVTYARELEGFQKLLNLYAKDHPEDKDIQRTQEEFNLKIEYARQLYQGYTTHYKLGTIGTQIPEILKEQKQQTQPKLSEERRDLIRARYNEIQAERKKEYEEIFTQSESSQFNIDTIPPITVTEAIRLRRKREQVDMIRAARDVDTSIPTVAGAFNLAKEALKGVLSVGGEFAEKTTGGLLLAVSYTFAGPFMLAANLVRLPFVLVERSLCYLKGFVGMAERFFKEISDSTKNPVGSALAKGASKFFTGIKHFFSALAKGFGVIGRFLDPVSLMKRFPIGAGALMGLLIGVGVIAAIALTVGTLGIGGIIIAGVAAGATIGAVVYGYQKGKARAHELVNPQLTADENMRLMGWEHSQKTQKQLEAQKAKAPEVSKEDVEHKKVERKAEQEEPAKKDKEPKPVKKDKEPEPVKKDKEPAKEDEDVFYDAIDDDDKRRDDSLSGKF